ncbi:MAG: hypothetical protein ABS938_16635 [Psychrobacillus psychrodurans]
MRTIQSEFKTQRITKHKNTTSAVKKPRVKEQLSKWELEELMGMRMPTYKRSKGGAIRSK